MNLFLRVCGALAAAASFVAAQQPLISIPVGLANGGQVPFNLFEGDNIANAAAKFINANGLQGADANGQLREALVAEANVRARALRAESQAEQDAAAAAAAAAQAAAAQQQPAAVPERLSVTVDVNINVPFTYTEGEDAVQVAQAFCQQHGLSPTDNVPALVQLLRSKAAEEEHAREAASQAAAAAAAKAARVPVLTVPLTIGGNSVQINLYDGDVVSDVARDVCAQLDNSALYPELVKVLESQVRAM